VDFKRRALLNQGAALSILDVFEVPSRGFED